LSKHGVVEGEAHDLSQIQSWLWRKVAHTAKTGPNISSDPYCRVCMLESQKNKCGKHEIEVKCVKRRN